MKNKLMSLLMLTAISPSLAGAHPFSGGNWEHHMGWGSNMGFMGGGLMMLFWIVLLVLLILSLGKWLFKGNPTATHEAYQILAQRLAKGEISKEEYTDIKKQLK